jgi:hypothetical protein
MRSLVIEQVGDSAAGSRWKEGAVKRVLANEKYRGLMIWGKKTFERRPGTRQLVARALPRDSWRTLERPDLRIVSEDLWQRVHARRAAEMRDLSPSAVDRSDPQAAASRTADMLSLVVDLLANHLGPGWRKRA